MSKKACVIVILVCLSFIGGFWYQQTQKKTAQENGPEQLSSDGKKNDFVPLYSDMTPVVLPDVKKGITVGNIPPTHLEPSKDRIVLPDVKK